MIDEPIEQKIAQARNGNLDSLEQVIRAIQNDLYRVAIHMLGDIEDAQDATQEILVKVVTHLDQFRGESAFSTWAHRIAINHLLSVRKRRHQQRTMSFAQLRNDIDTGLAFEPTDPAALPDQDLLTEEVKLNCTLGMLQCLDPSHRIAYILGEVIEVSGEEGGAILAISPAAYRQRLARARQSLRNFMNATCGLVNSNNPCRCSRQIAPSLHSGRLDPATLRFARHPTETPFDRARDVFQRRELVQLDRAAAVIRSHPAYQAPDSFVAAIRKLLTSGDFDILQ